MTDHQQRVRTVIQAMFGLVKLTMLFSVVWLPWGWAIYKALHE